MDNSTWNLERYRNYWKMCIIRIIVWFIKATTRFFTFYIGMDLRISCSLVIISYCIRSCYYEWISLLGSR